MEKKPLTMVAKDARDAAKKLNEYVEKGAYSFDFGISTEYSITVGSDSNGNRTEEKEKRFRFTGFMDMYVGEELDSLNAVREDLNKTKKDREEMNRTLNIMNKSPFAPISIFLLIIGVILLAFGVLTLARILPLPQEQIVIAVILTILGGFALAGSILLTALRAKKKNDLLSRKDEILKQDDELKEREKEVDARTPVWYKNALWIAEGNTIRNATQRYTLK